MATVTKKFKADFETWAQDRIDRCEWTLEEIDGLRGLLRQDLSPGPDVLRQGVTVLTREGIKIPNMIDDHEERYRLWADYFDGEAQAIRANARQAA